MNQSVRLAVFDLCLREHRVTLQATGTLTPRHEPTLAQLLRRGACSWYLARSLDRAR
jgi:hypothetical protein